MENNKIKTLFEDNDIDGLTAILVHDRDWFMRLEAAEALALLKDPRGIDYLVVSLQDPDSEVRGVAEEILTELDDPRGNQALKDIEQQSTRQCPHCQQNHPVSVSFCPITGEKLQYLKFCSNCGTPVEPDWRVCGECGTPLQPGTKVPSKQKPAKPTSRSIPGWVSWAGGVVIILVILIFSVLFYNNYFKQDEVNYSASRESQIESSDYGAYLVQDSQYLPLDYIEGGPVVQQYTPTTYSKSELPLLTLRYPNLNTAYLEL